MEWYYGRLSETTTQVDESKPNNVKLGGFTVCSNKFLGKGAFSTVYLCEDKDRNKAAVKILNKKNLKSDHALKVAKAETKTIRKLKHPCIAGYMGSFESPNNYYILLKYYEGITLKQILKNAQGLLVQDAINILVQLIDVLKYLHSKKIMHRDLKPDNIKYFQRQIVLLDFGFACELPEGDKTLLSESVGTPSYMSPEMLRNKKYNSKSDIWSLGALMYELIYGQTPWTGSDETELLSNITQKELKFPTKPKIPQELQKLIQSCLMVKPE